MPVFQQAGDGKIVSYTDTDQRIELPSLPSDNPAIRLVNLQAGAAGSDLVHLWLKLGGAAVSGSKTTSMLVRPGSLLEPLILGVGTATHLSVFADGGGTGDMLLTPGRIVEGAATGATGEAAGLGFTFSDTTAMADPGSGLLRFDNGTVASVSNIAIDDESRDGVDVSAYLTAFDDSTSTVKGHVIITVANDPSKIAIFQVDSLTDNSGWVQLGVTHIASAGTIANDDEIQVEFRPKGDKGDTGSTGPDGVHAGLKFAFDNSTTMADPGSGDFRLNNATLSSVTAAAVSDNSADTGNPDVSAAVLAWDDSDSAVRGTLRIKKVSAPENFAIYQISGASTDNAGWTQLALTYVDHAGSFSDTDECVLEFSRTGDKGDKGDTGDTGATGPVDTSGTPVATDYARFTDADTIEGRSPAEVRGDLNLEIGTDVQAWDADLDTLAGLSSADGNFIVGSATGWVVESGGTVRTSLGLSIGSDVQAHGAVLDDLNTLGAVSSDGEFLVGTGAGAFAYESGATARTSLGLSIGSDVQAFDADTLKADTADVLTAGFATTVFNSGTQSSGTYTPDEANGNFQRAVNGGAHTLAPPTNDCNIVVQYTNNASAGAITTSGFTAVTGDSFDTTDGNDFLAYITKINGFSHLNVVALQ